MLPMPPNNNELTKGAEIIDDKQNIYRVEKLIKMGGFGITYLTTRQTDGRKMVIKISNKEVGDEIIQQEWNKLTRVSHPNIVKFDHLFKNPKDRLWYLVMEYVDGKDLKEYIESQGSCLKLYEAVQYIRDIGQAVQYLHETEGLLHCDIKPSNIILENSEKPQRVVLIDFGAARYYSENLNSKTLENTHIFHTDNYSPYEQYGEKHEKMKMGLATDIYSLAATLYFLLTGQRPVSAKARFEENQQLVPPKEHNSEISEIVNDALLKGMELYPEDRPQSVQEWLNLLKKTTERNQFSQNQDYSFVTDILNPGQIFYFTLKDNEIKKIGDGSYGVVYEGHDNENNIYAIKILYDRYYDSSGNSKSIAESRFNAEIKSSKIIRESLDYINQTKIVGVIKNLAGTNQFKKSLAFTILQKKHQISGLSNYALVMEKFDGTLEDYLEKPIEQMFAIYPTEYTENNTWGRQVFKSKPDAMDAIETEIQSEDQKKFLKAKIYQLNGYDLLRQMNFNERVANILPYLQDIAQGLQTLHQAGYLHLDLKPANIFIRDSGKEVQAVIGDLGFLDQSQSERNAQLLQGKYEFLPLGTRHFQSPEQREFFDIAHVEINSDFDRQLIIKDPKFKDSIIEKGDYAIFSRNRHKEYPIKLVKIPSASDNDPVYITLDLKQEDRNDLKPGDTTQVFFYKVQGKRTDLFGFGAIVFNLLTCGKSPMYFYESIRSNYDIRNSQVDTLIEYYEQVSSFQSSEPVLIKLFEPFKDDESTEYAPKSLVELILKCILYQADNTFYKAAKNQEQEPTEILLNQIISLHQNDDKDDSSSLFNFKRTNNDLLKRKLKLPRTSSEKNFIVQLNDLRNLPQEKFHLRLVQGFWYLQQLAKLIERHLERSTEQTKKCGTGFYFAELNPKNIIIKNSIQSNKPESLDNKYIVYKSKEAYESDLRNDLVFTKISIPNPQGNPYIPALFSGMRREIFLQGCENSETSLNQYICKYDFSDRYESQVYVDDWVVAKFSNQSHNALYQIKKVNPQERVIELQIVTTKLEGAGKVGNFNNLSNKYIYYRAINPCIYYLHLLGTYIYDLFFWGWGGNDYELIHQIYNQFNIQLYFMGLGKSHGKVEINPKRYHQSFLSRLLDLLYSDLQDVWLSNNEKNLLDILYLLAEMYLKLTIFNSKQSYYQSQETDIQRIGEVLGDLDQLKEKIANFLEIQQAQLQSLRTKGSFQVNNTKLSNDLKLQETNKYSRLFEKFYKLVDSQCKIKVK